MRENKKKTLNRFDLKGSNSKKKFKEWNKILNSQYFSFDLHDQNHIFSEGSLEVLDISDIELGLINCDRFSIIKNFEHKSKSIDDYYFIPIPLKCEIFLLHRDKNVYLSPKSFTVVNASETFTYHQKTKNTVFTIKIKGNIARQRIPFIEDSVCLTNHAKMPLVQIMINHLKNIFSEADSLNFDQLKMLSFQILDLLARILFSQNKNFTQKKETTVRLAHFKRIINTIDENLKNENFNTQKLSNKIGLSERYIQKILSNRNVTVSQIIRKRRLEMAERWLSDPSRNSLSISTIGFSVGFSDAAHFSRTFRKYNGFSPKKYRENVKL